MLIMGCSLTVSAVGYWLFRPSTSDFSRAQSEVHAIPVIAVRAVQRDMPVKFNAKGTVSAIQTVEVYPQVTATIKAVHITEGQFVNKGERLFTLDTRAEEAGLAKSVAQLAKTRAELSNAERQLERQRELFHKNFISQAALDVAENQVAILRGQLRFDQAAIEADRVVRDYGEIVAPIAGRTGIIRVYPGSLVRPEATLLVSITQIDPIHVSFVLPERELAPLMQALNRDEVKVTARLDLPNAQTHVGRVVFIDSAVDSASGTIRVKAEFANAEGTFWPGMFANVTLISSTLPDVLTLPAQAVQNDIKGTFVFVVDENYQVSPQPVHVRLIQEGIAVVEGIAPDDCVVVEGTQSIRPGSIVKDHDSETEDSNDAGRQGCGQGPHTNRVVIS